MFLSNLPKHFVINYLIYAKELELHLTYVELWLSFMPLFIENSDYIVKRRCSVILYTIATYLPKNLAKMNVCLKMKRGYLQIHLFTSSSKNNFLLPKFS